MATGFTKFAKLFNATFVADLYSSEFPEGADVARSQAENAMVAADAKGDGEAKVVAHLMMANYYLKKRDATSAEQELDDAGKMSRRVKYNEGKAAMLVMQAKLELWYGSAEEAVSWSRDALKLFSTHSNQRGKAFGNHMHAFVLAAARKPQEGMRCAKEALTIYQEMQEKTLEVGVLRLLMDMFITAGDTLRAGLTGWEIVRVVGETGGEKKHKVKLAGIIKRIADIEFQGNDMEKCMEAAEDACARFQEAGDVEGEAAVMKTMMNVYLHKKKFYEGADVAKAIVDLYREAGVSDKRLGGALIDQAQVYLQGDCYDEAVEAASRALAVFQQSQDKEGTKVAGDMLKELNLEQKKQSIKLIIELNRSRLGHIPTNLIIAPDGLDIDAFNGFAKPQAKGGKKK